MLFHVRMDVHLPRDLSPEARAEILAREKACSQELQRAGKWPQLWRIVGEYANFSICSAAILKGPVPQYLPIHSPVWTLPR